MKPKLPARWNRLLTAASLGLAPLLAGQATVIQVPEDQPTLQAAVQTAAAGDEINLAPGTHNDQVILENRDLTLSGRPGAVLRAWPGMQRSARYGWSQIVEATGGSLHLRDLTFEGEHLHEALQPNYGFAAISLNGTTTTIERCGFRGFRGELTLGLISSAAIVTWNPTNLGGGVMQVDVRGSTFVDNALAVWLTGDWMAHPAVLRTRFNIEDNTITGLGPAGPPTPYGLFIVGGAGGGIRRNRFADFRTNADGPVRADAILRYDMSGMSDTGHVVAPLQPLQIEDNHFENNQEAIGLGLANGSTIARNTFLGGDSNQPGYGVIVSGNGIAVTANRFTDLESGLTLIGTNDPRVGTVFGLAKNVTIDGNRFCDVTLPVLREAGTTQINETGSLTCPVPVPPLTIAVAVRLSWPDDGESHVVESADSLEGPWTALTAAPGLEDGLVVVSVETTAGRRYFRLR